MATRAYFLKLADYNAWANRRLYDAAAELPDADYRRDVGAFFRSMHGTLNHILVADRIWLQRITGEGEAPTELDGILHDDLPGLRQAREREDDRIRDVVAGLSDADLAGTFGYVNLRSGQRFDGQPLGLTVAHLFNHQTHHRGQAHGILSGLGREPPPLDILYFIR